MRFFALACFYPFVVGSLDCHLPKMIDFAKIDYCPNGIIDEDELHQKWKESFNSTPEIGGVFAYLRELYGIHTVIETGTHQGQTTGLLARIFPTVHSIEIDTNLLETTAKCLSSYANITFHPGRSETVLTDILKTGQLLQQKIIVYLDAHQQDHWPLIDEIKAISQTHRDRCIVIVNDYKVPSRPDLRFDVYNQQESAYRYLQPVLNEIFSSYTMHYLLPKHYGHRAKLLLIPQSIC